MIKQAKKRGYVTHEQLNAVLPSEEVSSDQIEDIYAMLNEMGINVVEQEEGADEEEAKPAEEAEEEDDSDGELVEAKPKALATTEKPRSRPSAPTIRSACICAKWARSSCCRARAKSPSPSASRPAARR